MEWPSNFIHDTHPMTYTKKSLLAITAASIVGATMLGVGATFAAAPNATPINRMHSLVQALADKFHVNTTDVQAVFDAQHAQQVTDRVAQEKTRLDKAVTDGKLTQDQENLIIAKQAEQKTFMESLKGKTKAEIQTAMKTNGESLKKWITDNKIPQAFFHFGFGPEMGRGFGGRMGASGFHRMGMNGSARSHTEVGK